MICRSHLPALLLLGSLGILAGCESSSSSAPAETLTIVEGPTVELEPGGTVQLTARGGSGTTAWSSSAPAVATVVPVTGFVEAVAAGEARITAIRGSAQADVTVRVVEPPLILLAPPELAFQAQTGGSAPPPATVSVTNAGGGSLGAISVTGVTYGIGETGGWLSHQVVGAGVQFTAAPGTLPPGIYTATAAVAASQARNSPQSVAVTFRVEGTPVIQVTPNPLTVVVVEGTNPGTLELQVSNAGPGTLSALIPLVSYPQGGPLWLGIATMVQQVNGGLIRFTPSTASLPRGTYIASLRVQSSVEGVEPVVVPIELTVAQGPALVLSPAAVTIPGVLGGANPAPRSVAVTNGGGGTLGGLTRSVSYQAGQSSGWLSTTLTGTTAPAELQLVVNTNGLSQGTYTASVTVSSPDAENSPLVLPVTLVLSTPAVVSLNPASINISGVVNSTNPGARAVNVTNIGGGTLEGISLGTPVYSGGATNWLAVTIQPGPVAPTSFTIQGITGGLTPGVYTAQLPVTSSTPGAAPATLQVQLTVLAPSFAAEVYPAIGNGGAASCGSCHDGTPAPNFRGTAAAVRQTLLNGGWVVPGNPGGSNFVCRLTPGSACSHSKLSAAQAERARLWVLYGANP